jgi:uncharacterized protein YecE (DUF72 family)
LADRNQLSLLASAPTVEPVLDPEIQALASRLPSKLYFGTSSWTFPGWAGIVYAGQPSMASLVKAGLSAYARYPLFRTVGIDRGYYAPLEERVLVEYAAQLPPGFRAVLKVPSELTTRVFPSHPRFGTRAGKENPYFLDTEWFREEVIAPLSTAFASHAAVLLFEFPPTPLDPDFNARDFAIRLDRFLDEMPSGWRFAIELRNRDLFTPRYLHTLEAHRVAHTLNFWSWMPPLSDQLRISRILTAPSFAIARLSLAPGARYEEQRDTFAPFDRIVVPQLGLRRDILELWLRCSESDRELWVIVNNKVEGSSPLTVRALAESIVENIGR